MDGEVCYGFGTFTVTFILATIGLFNNNNCEQIVQRTFLWIAFSLAIVTLISSCCSIAPGCSTCTEFISSLVWLLFFSYFIFGLTVTHKGGGDKLLGKAYKEYRLDHYHHWLQNRVNDTNRWHGINACLIRRHVCKKMTNDWANITAEQFYSKRLSSIQSGCCKPSNDCNFSYITPTNWTKTVNSSNTNPDCEVWNNSPDVWCFGCQACKAGVADKFKHNWYDILNFYKD